MDIAVAEREREREREIKQLAGSAEDHTWKKEWMASQCESVQHTVFGQCCPPNAPSASAPFNRKPEREKAANRVRAVPLNTQFSVMRN